MVLGQGERLVASPSDIQNSAKYSLGLKIDPSTFFLFCKFDFSCFFWILLSTSPRMRKIGDFKNNALQVKRVPKIFENLNSFEMMIKC